MKYKNILLTGGSGKLGQAIINSGYFSSLLNPPKAILDITKPETIEKFFNDNDINAVIHCAALAKMKKCEEDPIKAIHTNIIGTSNLVMEVIKKENKLQKKIRFIHISTDGVYASTEGNYSEKSPTIPYNNHGWAKLGAECAVNFLSNFCIIRTRFFDPKNIRFNESAVDSYSSRVTVDYIAKAIAEIINHDFIGTVNIAGERKSEYEHYKKFKPALQKCTLNDILKTVSFAMSRDASMDCTLWHKLKKEIDLK